LIFFFSQDYLLMQPLRHYKYINYQYVTIIFLKLTVSR